MDFSKFKTSDWLKVGGGLGFLIFGFFKWFGVDCDGEEFCEQFLGDVGLTAWDFTFSGILAFILLAAVAVLTFLSVTGTFKLPSNIPAPLVFLAASGLATLMVVLRFLNSEDGVSRKIGLFLCLAAAIASLVGCVLGFKESGGDLADLKDPNKLKGAFQQAGGSVPPPPPGMTPPPPPPGMTPPPPPPPSGMAPPPPPPPA